MFCVRVDSRAAGGIHGLDSEHEDIRVHVFAVDEALGLLEAGRIANAHSVIALQWLALHHEAVRRRWLDDAVSAELYEPKRHRRHCDH